MAITTLQKKLRKKILLIASRTGSGYPHVGSCLSCIDIITQTILFEMKPSDKFILSKGHASLALYVVLNEAKKISDKAIDTYLKDGGHFGIHPPLSYSEDIPLATGSLGHGLSFACGVAKGYLLQNQSSPRVFCLMSDGECNEGAVWEAALFASRHKLNNLVALIDKNGWQAFGKIKDVLGDAATVAKWRAFGFNVYRTDGHSLSNLKKTFYKIRQAKNNKPHVIICKTYRAYGIRKLQNKLQSNYLPLDKNMLKSAFETLKIS